jgi:hypothetical protein
MDAGPRIIRGLGWVIGSYPEFDANLLPGMTRDEVETMCRNTTHEDSDAHLWLIWGNMKDLLEEWEWKADHYMIVPHRMWYREEMMEHCEAFLQDPQVVQRLRCPNKGCEGNLI